MSKVNRGKDFENQIRQSFEKVPETTVVRLMDPQNGYVGVCNLCDFIVYHYPHQYLIECKSCYGNTLPFSNISKGQWDGLAVASNVPGVVAGYMIWFIDHDRTVFVPARSMLVHKELGEKSWNIAKQWDSDYIEIKGTKKRVLFDYDLSDFLEKMRGYNVPV